jgi:hypothetical protein
MLQWHVSKCNKACLSNKDIIIAKNQPYQAPKRCGTLLNYSTKISPFRHKGQIKLEDKSDGYSHRLKSRTSTHCLNSHKLSREAIEAWTLNSSSIEDDHGGNQWSYIPFRTVRRINTEKGCKRLLRPRNDKGFNCFHQTYNGK